MASLASAPAATATDTLMRVSGKGAWVCENCGSANINYLRGDSNTVSCGDCERIFDYAVIVRPARRGRHRRYAQRELLQSQRP